MKIHLLYFIGGGMKDLCSDNVVWIIIMRVERHRESKNVKIQSSFMLCDRIGIKRPYMQVAISF